MPARGGDLQRALDVFLPHHVGKVGAGLLRCRRRPARGRGDGLLPAQVGNQGVHVADGINRQPVGQRGLRGVFRRNEQVLHTAAHRGHGHGQHAAHAAQLSGERQLAQKGGVRRQLRKLLGTAEDAEKDRQVVDRALLALARGGQIDRDAGDRELCAAVFHCRAHPLPRFLHGGVAKTDDVKRGKSSREETLHRHLVSADALKAQRAHGRDHCFFPLSCIAASNLIKYHIINHPEKGSPRAKKASASVRCNKIKAHLQKFYG